MAISGSMWQVKKQTPKTRATFYLNWFLSWLKISMILGELPKLSKIYST